VAGVVVEAEGGVGEEGCVGVEHDVWLGGLVGLVGFRFGEGGCLGGGKRVRQGEGGDIRM
jgi:hypothetical protein